MITKTETPRSYKAWKNSIDDTGCVTRMEPIWETMETLERDLSQINHDWKEKCIEADTLRQHLLTAENILSNSKLTRDAGAQDL